ncbi:MAG: YebC/PmpR family DNA-binding transcriptional regulator [Eubacteriales bacterium]|nr:YebC/PmpR family DNA-binding transcriptional regulator [Eubacteriales bacterium]MDD3880626.1 YebC/PmpR family DNA-binding transcriptional regulator [Eubacteriales bacterium]MDD4513532.1 YebC/PmpR family DNA-binding transcriptional regulator [Eubacteriales bacterium]
MSGHSKWANIKHKKGKADAERGKIFTKIGREIAIAVREGGADPDVNGKLRDVIAKAKASNMPNDNISRSIKKAAGEGSNVNYEEITYEGYAPGGVAVLVEVVTDNRNRTASEIRHAFDKNGGSMGTTGSVGYMFDHRGVIDIEREPGMDEDEFMMTALDLGAEDVNTDDDEVFEVYTKPNDFSNVRQAFEKNGMTILSAEVAYLPQNLVEVDAENVEKIQKMLDMFDDNDDVQNAFHNANLPEDEEEDD